MADLSHIPDEAVTADSDRFPWVNDLNGDWHFRPPGQPWATDRADGTNALTVCEQWVASVHVSNVPPESRLCGPCIKALAAALPVLNTAKDSETATWIDVVIARLTAVGGPDVTGAVATLRSLAASLRGEQ